MSKKEVSILCITIIVSAILCSCATTPKVTAEYLELPKGVSNIKEIDTLVITKPQVSLSGNGFSKDDKQIIENYLSRKIAADFYKEGFYHVGDVLWGNGDSEGLKKAQELLDKYQIPHGYSTVSSENIKFAELSIAVNLSSSKSKKDVSKEIKLKVLPYKTESSNGKPYSTPDYSRVRYNKTKVDLVEYVLNYTGSLSVKLISKDGKSVFKKEYPPSKYLCKLGGEEAPKPFPTITEVVSHLFKNEFKEMISDISPHYTEREIYINENGHKKGVLLLNALAFSKTIDVLDNIITEGNSKNPADYQNMGTALEIVGDYMGAEHYYNEALKLDPENPELQKSLKKIKQVIGQNKKFQENEIEKNSKYDRKEYKNR